MAKMQQSSTMREKTTVSYQNAQSKPGPFDGLVQTAIAALLVLVGVAIYVSVPTWTRPFAPHFIGLWLTQMGFILMLCSYILFEANSIQREKLHCAIGCLAALSAVALVGILAHTMVSGGFEGGLAAQLVEFILKKVCN
ncbi:MULTISPECIES: hypothetical protein [Pseudomonadati]|jgi:hypothetical protein|nr:hypothetical protein AAU61_22145 [Desulfocarbo indianensis]MBA9859169.1 hypothetical protein [Ralstonia insidiosa]MBA9939337.1 hypothetical protein [Ralstonia insidiosa]MBC9968108.1 hypothetical protein [Ralstonia insidiosa]MBX3904329.1 hypothetical protein [Ralstonia insidiosa]